MNRSSAVAPVAAMAFALGCGGTASTSSTGGSDPLAELDQEARDAMRTAELPGMALAIVRGDRLIASRGYGLADIASAREVTSDTLFMLASVSKTVTAVALMQRFERGDFALDDPIDDALPFPVRNPAFPDVAITYRMLLTHTSSIEDSGQIDAHLTLGADSPISLADFLDGYLNEGGAYYRKANWNHDHAPGTHASYSNVGASLAGELVEALAGTDLQTDCEAHVFTPLGMKESSWFLKGLDLDHLAMPYRTDSHGAFVAIGQYGFPDYPDGQLRTSADQLARFLMALVGEGALDGARVLSPSTVDEMERIQFPKLDDTQGLILYEEDFGPYRLIGHSGGYLGVSTDMFFDPATGAGFVMLSNGDVYDRYDGGPKIQALVSLETDLYRAALGP